MTSTVLSRSDHEPGGTLRRVQLVCLFGKRRQDVSQATGPETPPLRDEKRQAATQTREKIKTTANPQSGSAQFPAPEL